jgi:hypothetical protein
MQSQRYPTPSYMLVSAVGRVLLTCAPDAIGHVLCLRSYVPVLQITA